MNLLFRAVIGIPFTPFSSYIVILNYFIAKKKNNAAVCFFEKIWHYLRKLAFIFNLHSYRKYIFKVIKN